MSQKDKFVGWAAIAVGLGAASTSAWMPTTAASAFATQALGAAAVIYGAWSLTARRHTGGHWGLFAIGLMLTLSPWFGGFIQERAVSITLSAGIALLLTFPMIITVNYLGEPDNGAIFTGYFGSWLLAGSYLAIGSCMSALAKNQVIAFILAVSACFLFIVSGFPMVLDAFAWAPQWLLDAVASLSFLTRFDAISKGVIDLRDLLYFITLMAAWLAATAVVVDLKKAD